MALAAAPATAHSLPSQALRRFSWAVLVYFIAVILWGALVRATGSGAGCGGHWPLCNGDVLPDVSHVATVIERTHRLTRRLGLVLVAASFSWSRKAFLPGHPTRR